MKENPAKESAESNGEDPLQNELLNDEAAKKLKQAEDQANEMAHGIERDMK